MISEKMTEALNKQMNAELYSWYLYLAMSSHFESQNFGGTAKWLKLQANEEMGHAMKIYAYINQVGKKAELQKIDAPPAKFTNHVDVFNEVVKHELFITKSVNELADLAVAEKDHATGNFLAWFVNEQVEEVATATQLYEKIKIVSVAPGGLYMIDRELGMRA